MFACALRITAILSVAAVAGGACSDSTAPFSPPYNPQIPTSWATTVSNSFFPLVRGTRYEYRGQTPDGLETIIVEVLQAPKMVNGVAATEVRDRVYLDGELIEDTFDWYAQATDGNVWYLGESAKEYENGVVVSTAGSWEWGIDGALPGIVMWNDPGSHIAEEYRQEFYRNEAEDWAKVVSIGQSATVPYGSFTGCIVTEDWNGLEPDDPRENKTYCPQVGVVREAKIGSTEKIELYSRTP